MPRSIVGTATRIEKMTRLRIASVAAGKQCGEICATRDMFTKAYAMLKTGRSAMNVWLSIAVPLIATDVATANTQIANFSSLKNIA
jgi:hypothetical protein